MRIDKLISDRTPKKRVPTSLDAIYEDSDIQEGWNSLYPSEDETDQLMEEYHEDLKERDLLTNHNR